MLENSLIESGARARTRKPVTVVASTVTHVGLIAALVLIPLLEPQAVPMLSTAYGLPLPPPLKPNLPIEVVRPLPRIQAAVQPSPGELIAPTAIPQDIARVVDAPDAGLPMPRGSTGVISSIFAPLPEKAVPIAPPPPPPPALPKTSTGPLRVGGNVELANLISQIKPIYPPIARQARVQGVVVLEATISKGGSVVDVRILSGNPLLNEAATDAVRQWRYKPTMLNGEPVEVITTITINFALQ